MQGKSIGCVQEGYHDRDVAVFWLGSRSADEVVTVCLCVLRKRISNEDKRRPEELLHGFHFDKTYCACGVVSTAGRKWSELFAASRFYSCSKCPSSHLPQGTPFKSARSS